MTPTDDQLDAAIDAVAREMTAGAPADPSAFRRRVLDGVDARSTPRRTLRAAWVVPPFAAAAAIVIAVVMFRGASDTTVRLIHNATEAQHPPMVRREPDVTDAQLRATVRLPAARSAVRNDRSGRGPARPSSVETERSGGGTQPLDIAQGGPPPLLAIAPIDVAPLGAARLAAADSIELPRLEAITPIDVTPLGLDDSQRRDE